MTPFECIHGNSSLHKTQSTHITERHEFFPLQSVVCLYWDEPRTSNRMHSKGRRNALSQIHIIQNSHLRICRIQRSESCDMSNMIFNVFLTYKLLLPFQVKNGNVTSHLTKSLSSISIRLVQRTLIMVLVIKRIIINSDKINSKLEHREKANKYNRPSIQQQ